MEPIDEIFKKKTGFPASQIPPCLICSRDRINVRWKEIYQMENTIDDPNTHSLPYKETMDSVGGWRFRAKGVQIPS